MEKIYKIRLQDLFFMFDLMTETHTVPLFNIGAQNKIDSWPESQVVLFRCYIKHLLGEGHVFFRMVSRRESKKLSKPQLYS